MSTSRYCPELDETLSTQIIKKVALKSRSFLKCMLMYLIYLLAVEVIDGKHILVFSIA